MNKNAIFYGLLILLVAGSGYRAYRNGRSAAPPGQQRIVYNWQWMTDAQKVNLRKHVAENYEEVLDGLTDASRASAIEQIVSLIEAINMPPENYPGNENTQNEWAKDVGELKTALLSSVGGVRYARYLKYEAVLPSVVMAERICARANLQKKALDEGDVVLVALALSRASRSGSEAPDPRALVARLTTRFSDEIKRVLEPEKAAAATRVFKELVETL